MGRAISIKGAGLAADKAAALRAMQVKRYERALSGLKRAQSRVKRAATLLRKYQRQCRYYVRTLGGGV